MKNLKNKLGLLVLFISGILLNAQLGLSQQQIGSKPCYMPKNGYGTGGCASKPGGYSESIWKKPAQQPNSHTPRPCDQTPIVVEHGSVEIKDEWTQLIHCDRGYQQSAIVNEQLVHDVPRVCHFGIWSSYIVPCLHIQCSLLQVSNGEVLVKTINDIDQASLTCHEGYKRTARDLKPALCNKPGEWSKSLGECQVIKNGPHGNDGGGRR